MLLILVNQDQLLGRAHEHFIALRRSEYFIWLRPS